MSKRLLTTLFVMALAGCAGNHASEAEPPINGAASQTMIRHNLVSPIQHVIIVVQENRTVDNLFQGLPGATTQSWGLNSENQHVTLQPVPLTAHYDLSHAHTAFLGDYNKGAMNGFDKDTTQACAKNTCPSQATASYGYAPQSETGPYFDLAAQFAFGDEMFQTNEGPSFPLTNTL